MDFSSLFSTWTISAFFLSGCCVCYRNDFYPGIRQAVKRTEVSEKLSEYYTLLQNVLRDARSDSSDALGKPLLSSVDLGLGRSRSATKVAKWQSAFQESQSSQGPGKRRRRK